MPKAPTKDDPQTHPPRTLERCSDFPAYLLVLPVQLNFTVPCFRDFLRLIRYRSVLAETPIVAVCAIRSIRQNRARSEESIKTYLYEASS